MYARAARTPHGSRARAARVPRCARARPDRRPPGASAGAAGAACGFNPADPDGAYTLNLALPVERAVAAALADIDVAAGTDPMKNIKLDGRVG